MEKFGRKNPTEDRVERARGPNQMSISGGQDSVRRSLGHSKRFHRCTDGKGDNRQRWYKGPMYRSLVRVLSVR